MENRNTNLRFPRLTYYNDIILGDIVGWTVITDFDDYHSQCFGNKFNVAFKDWIRLVDRYIKIKFKSLINK